MTTLNRHQVATCCVACGSSSLRSINYTPQSSHLGALHLTPCWRPGTLDRSLMSYKKIQTGDGFGKNNIKFRINGGKA